MLGPASAAQSRARAGVGRRAGAFAQIALDLLHIVDTICAECESP
jgi:hypothetical protein